MVKHVEDISGVELLLYYPHQVSNSGHSFNLLLLHRGHNREFALFSNSSNSNKNNLIH